MKTIKNVLMTIGWWRMIFKAILFIVYVLLVKRALTQNVGFVVILFNFTTDFLFV